MAAHQVNITDRAKHGAASMRSCLLCDLAKAAECSVDTSAGRVPYALCQIHWKRFVENDRQMLAKIEELLEG